MLVDRHGENRRSGTTVIGRVSVDRSRPTASRLRCDEWLARAACAFMSPHRPGSSTTRADPFPTPPARRHHSPPTLSSFQQRDLDRDLLERVEQPGDLVAGGQQLVRAPELRRDSAEALMGSDTDTGRGGHPPSGTPGVARIARGCAAGPHSFQVAARARSLVTSGPIRPLQTGRPNQKARQINSLVNYGTIPGPRRAVVSRRGRW